MTTAVFGALVPPDPVATAVYVVFAVGESTMLPEAELLVVTVRVEVPLAAVIVIELDAVAVQVNVTDCPAVTVVGVADKTMLGTAGGGIVEEPPVPQAVNDRSSTNASAKVSLRKTSEFM